MVPRSPRRQTKQLGGQEALWSETLNQGLTVPAQERQGGANRTGGKGEETTTEYAGEGTRNHRTAKRRRKEGTMERIKAGSIVTLKSNPTMKMTVEWFVPNTRVPTAYCCRLDSKGQKQAAQFAVDALKHA